MVLPEEPDLARLFEDLEFKEEEPKTPPSTIRCSCGAVMAIRMPCQCPRCHAVKPFWREKDGSTVALQHLDLGRLTMIARTLGERAEGYETAWPERRRELEIALDIVFNEISTRDKEIEQQRGILSALMKGFKR
jgi:hypothetical protein